MGYVYLYTGTGAGKITNTLGLALHSVGHGYKVIIIDQAKFVNEIVDIKHPEKIPTTKEI